MEGIPGLWCPGNGDRKSLSAGQHHHGNPSLIADLQETAVGKPIPPSEGNKLGLHSLEMFTNLNSQIKLAEFQPTFIKIAS